MLHADQVFVPEPWPPEPQGMNFAWLLDDFTAENGDTEVVPGSHRAADDVDPATRSDQAVPVIAPAGTLVVFERRLWHRTGCNRSSNPRAALCGWYTRPIYRTQGLGLVYGRSPR